MIKTREDLKFYLQEDAKANRMDVCSLLNYWVRLFIGSESAHVYQYLKVLRHCEYHCNNSGFFHKMLYRYYRYVCIDWDSSTTSVFLRMYVDMD